MSNITTKLTSPEFSYRFLQRHGPLEVIARQIQQHCDPRTIKALSESSVLLERNHAIAQAELQQHVQKHWATRIDPALRRFVTKPVAFRKLMTETRAMIIGAFVSDFWASGSAEAQKSRDMTILVRTYWDWLRIWRWLEAESGYVLESGGSGTRARRRNTVFVGHELRKRYRLSRPVEDDERHFSRETRRFDEDKGQGGKGPAKLLNIVVYVEQNPMEWLFTKLLIDTSRFAFITGTHAVHMYPDKTMVNKNVTETFPQERVSAAFLRNQMFWNKKSLKSLRYTTEPSGRRTFYDDESWVCRFDPLAVASEADNGSAQRCKPTGTIIKPTASSRIFEGNNALQMQEAAYLPIGPVWSLSSNEGWDIAKLIVHGDTDEDWSIGGARKPGSVDEYSPMLSCSDKGCAREHCGSKAASNREDESLDTRGEMLGLEDGFWDTGGQLPGLKCHLLEFVRQ